MTRRRKTARLVPVLSGALFLVVGLGLTCQEYLDLPQSGYTDYYIAHVMYGYPPLPSAANFQGKIDYDALWLGSIDAEGNLRDAALWRVNGACMWLAIFEEWALPWTVFGAFNDDIYFYYFDQEDWKKRYDALPPEESCNVFGFPWDLNEYAVYSGRFTLDCCTDGQVPYGVYHLTVAVSGDGFCVSGCTPDFRHRIP